MSGPRHIFDQAHPESDDPFETFCEAIMSTQDKPFKNQTKASPQGSHWRPHGIESEARPIEYAWIMRRIQFATLIAIVNSSFSPGGPIAHLFHRTTRI